MEVERGRALVLAHADATILTMPLSMSARKVVWGLIRLMSTMPSASCAYRSTWTGVPSSSAPMTTVSIVERTGTPIAASVMP